MTVSELVRQLERERETLLDNIEALSRELRALRTRDRILCGTLNTINLHVYAADRRHSCVHGVDSREAKCLECKTFEDVIRAEGDADDIEFIENYTDPLDTK